MFCHPGNRAAVITGLVKSSFPTLPLAMVIVGNANVN